MTNPDHFEPTWESLSRYECPDWFRDAKFGIWSHWGPQCVPEEGDWYARNMYIEGHRQAIAHREKYGHPSEFGFKDIVPLWKAENFDPERLMALYRKAGAKYFVSMGIHHDNFDMWDSKHHRWNAAKMGPKKDIVGLWAAAARGEGLRFGLSEHLERSYSWFNTNKGSDQEGPKAGVPYDGADPDFADFYFPPHDDTNMRYPKDPPVWWQEQWLARTKDLIDSYEPDLLYTDGGVPFGPVGRSMIAHYYNQDLARHEGRLEAVYTIKDYGDDDDEHGEYRDGIAVEDIERGVLKSIKVAPWQTDTSVADWYYRTGHAYKTTTEIVQMLADIVSKNGNLLMNFTQRADGTLDPESETILEELAEWMPINGEAIYGTRPWHTFGEGPTEGISGHFKEGAIPYTAQDMRFTTRGETLYAILLEWPGNGGDITIHSLTPDQAPNGIASVTLLGCEGELAYSLGADGLRVTMPDTSPGKHAYALKICPGS